MHQARKKRLILVFFLVGGIALTLTLVLAALNNNLDFFYSPAAIVAGEVPVAKRIRAGGMVVKGSLIKSQDSLDVKFMIGDLRGAEVPVLFTGLLPNLFAEGQGVVLIGELTEKGWIKASEVLAKHDENYMPRELTEALKDYQVPKQAGM